MKNFIIAFLVFLIWSFFGLWLYSWLNPVKQSDNLSDIITSENIEELPLINIDSLDNAIVDTLNLLENIQPNSEAETLEKGLKATNENGDVIFLFTEGISIVKDTSIINIPQQVVDFKYKINTYLIEHPNEEVQILSLYAASEKIKNPNLGFRRGNKVKELLKNLGIASEKIAVKPMIKDISFNEKNEYPYGVSFLFRPIDTVRLNALKNKLPEDKTIYPKLVNNDIFVNDALKELLEEVKNVFATNPNAIVQIIGHTDNIGNANDNYLLALKYARQVRWYLINKGNIERDKVVALSEGEAIPIANNNTEKGQFLNRRIEVKYRTN